MPHADLRAVATRLGVRRRDQHKKAQWADAVAATLLDPQQRQSWLAELTPAAHTALARLVEAGELPAHQFWGAYGSVRRAAAARGTGHKPWLRPESPAEELYYLGLLHPVDRAQLQRAARLQTAPDLRRLLAAHRPAPSQADGIAECLVLLHDVGQLVIFMHTGASAGLHKGRWLRRNDLEALNRRLLCPQHSVPLPPHRRSPRLVLLAFLAHAAGLHAAGRLTPSGWSWLRMAPAEQLRLLWEAWRSAPQSWRKEFGLPSAGISHVGLAHLLECLPAIAAPFTAGQLADKLAGTARALNTYLEISFPAAEDLTALVRGILAAELEQIGIVRCVTGRAKFRRKYVLTEAGRLLLSGGAEQFLFPTPAACTELKLVDGKLAVATPAAPVSPFQAVLAPFAEYVGMYATEPAPTNAVHHYRLDKASVAKAVAAGHSLPQLFTGLTGVGLDCTPEQQRLLAAWSAAAEAAQLRSAVLLETKTPDVLAELQRLPSVLPLLGRILRPTVAEVSGSASQLADRLATAGHIVSGPPVRKLRRHSKQTHAESAALWLAGMVYAEIGRHLPLPLPVPYDALAALYAEIAAADRSGVEGQLEQFRADLLQWLDHVVFVPPPEPSDPAQWLPTIQAALDQGRHLAVDYFSAGRNMLIHYVVEPYWLEERHGILYLRGDPQTGAREAVLFRLDRIKSLAFSAAGATAPPA